MPTTRRFAVILKEGRIVITPTSGEEATEADVTWINDIITNSLRSRNFKNTAEKPLRPDDYGVVHGKNWDVDEIIVKLSEIQKRRAIPTRDITDVLCLHHSMLACYKHGKTRPYLETVRSWAFLLGRDIQMIPMVLRKQVKQMVQDWEAERPGE